MYIIGQVWDNVHYNIYIQHIIKNICFQADYSKVDEAIAKANVLKIKMII